MESKEICSLCNDTGEYVSANWFDGVEVRYCMCLTGIRLEEKDEDSDDKGN